MSALRELAKQLGAKLQARAETQIRLAHLTADRDGRILFISPDKWPGSNPEERATSKAKALAADSPLIDMAGEIQDCHDDLAGLDADIDGVMAQMSAERWEVRQTLADYLRVKTAEWRPDPFTEVLQDELDAELGDEVVKRIEADIDNEFPF